MGRRTRGHGVCRVTVALGRCSTECRTTAVAAWPGLRLWCRLRCSPYGDRARCSTVSPEAMRVDVRELDAASVGARVGRSVRRLPRPPMPPSTTRFSYRGRWASGCLARWLIRGLRADMRTDDQDRLRSRRGKLPRLVAAGHWLCV